MVSILHPQFGSEWWCRCYTSCWCSYGFRLRLFLCCGFSGILFLCKVPFSTSCCFRRCAVVGLRPLPLLLVCICILLCLCVTYVSLYVLVCILYIYWYFSFLLSGPLFLCSLEFWVFGSAILLLISGVWLVPVVLLSFARFSTIGAGGLEDWWLGWAVFRCGSCDGGRAFYIRAVLRVFHLPSFLVFFYWLVSLAL